MNYTAHKIIQQRLSGKKKEMESLSSTENKRGGGDVKRERLKEKVRIGKKRCRQVCDLFKEMEGRGGGSLEEGREEQG